MSLNSLATNYIAKESSKNSPQGTSDNVLAPGNQDIQNALSALIEYVPSETITLYLAAVGALPALVTSITIVTAARVYWLFVMLTPILFALIYGGKRRAIGETRWPKFSEWESWPIWPMVASTVAFAAWGLAIPDSPFFNSEDGRVISGLIAIFASVILGVLGRFFAPKPKEPNI